jgi:hypothetical protein
MEYILIILALIFILILNYYRNLNKILEQSFKKCSNKILFYLDMKQMDKAVELMEVILPKKIDKKIIETFLKIKKDGD